MSGPEDLEVEFSSSTPGVTLSGVVARPEDRDLMAAGVLLSVAGPNDRDMSLPPHKFFRDLACGLAERGVASIRFDDRGVGGSGGSFLETDLDDRAADACRALAELRRVVGAGLRTGFIGMSEGGGIGVLAGQRCGPTDFTVLLSTPVRSGRSELESQVRRLIASSPLPESDKSEFESLALRLMDLASDADPERHRDAIRAILASPLGGAILPPYAFVPRTPEAQTDFVLSRWYRSQLSYDIEDALLETDGPMLAIYGELDQVIDAKANAERLGRVRPETHVRVVPALNHILQEARTGSPLEYAQLPGSISEHVVSEVGDWIRRAHE